MSELQDVLAAVDAHSDYKAIEQETFFELWDGEYPIFELESDVEESGGYRVEVTTTTEGVVVTLAGGEAENRLPAYYRLTSEDIKERLRVFEREGFEHVVSGPPTPDEDPFQQDLHALLGDGWELATINVPNRTVAASKYGSCLSILDGPSEWKELTDDTDPYALVQTAGETVTLLAEGLDGGTALRHWKRYMHAHPETRPQEGFWEQMEVTSDE